MPIYRTINQCYDSIVNEDSDTAITKFFIRKLCIKNLVHNIKSGNRFLIDLNSLNNYLKKQN